MPALGKARAQQSFFIFDDRRILAKMSPRCHRDDGPFPTDLAVQPRRMPRAKASHETKAHSFSLPPGKPLYPLTVGDPMGQIFCNGNRFCLEIPINSIQESIQKGTAEGGPPRLVCGWTRPRKGLNKGCCEPKPCSPMSTKWMTLSSRSEENLRAGAW